MECICTHYHFSFYIIYTYHYDIILQSRHILISWYLIKNSLQFDIILVHYDILFVSIVILKILYLNPKF